MRNPSSLAVGSAKMAFNGNGSGRAGEASLPTLAGKSLADGGCE